MDKKILVVDDDDDIRELIQEKFTDLGYTVDSAKTGAGALIKMSHNAYPAVITDLRMPEIDGIELISYIKANEQNRNADVFVLSGYLKNESQKSLNKLGIVAAYEKPIELNKLARDVQNALTLDVRKPKGYTSTIVDIVERAAIDTLGFYFKGIYQRKDQKIVKNSQSPAELTAIVPIFGSFFGSISLSMEKFALKHLLTELVGDYAEGGNEEADFMGEFGNQFAGRFKSILHQKHIEVLIGLPETIIDTTNVHKAPGRVAQIDISFESAALTCDFFVQFCLNEVTHKLPKNMGKLDIFTF